MDVPGSYESVHGCFEHAFLFMNFFQDVLLQELQNFAPNKLFAIKFLMIFLKFPHTL